MPRKKLKRGSPGSRDLSVLGRNYAGRDAYLKQIGFSSYEEYLNSDLWKEIRSAVYRIKGRDCHLCGNPADDLHHSRYHKNDLIGKKLRYISPVCRECHQKIEFNEDGFKRNVNEAALAFKRLRRRFLGYKARDFKISNPVLRFGKYAGKVVSDVPVEYCLWCLKHASWLDACVKSAMARRCSTRDDTEQQRKAHREAARIRRKAGVEGRQT